MPLSFFCPFQLLSDRNFSFIILQVSVRINDTIGQITSMFPHDSEQEYYTEKAHHSLQNQ